MTREEAYIGGQKLQTYIYIYIDDFLLGANSLHEEWFAFPPGESAVVKDAGLYANQHPLLLYQMATQHGLPHG